MIDGYAVSADFYDHVTYYRERPDVAFYVEEALRANGPVLELGCGSGRVLVPTAAAGVEIVGLDASAAMLQQCRAALDRSETVRARATLLQGDIRDFAVGRKFALITIPFRPFQHLLTVNDQMDCLTCVRHHLGQNGRFIFDVFNPSLEFLVTAPVGEETQTEPPFTLPDGRLVQRKGKVVRHDRPNQVTDHELIYYITVPNEGVERVVHSFSMRNSFKFELEHLLYRLGFEVEHVYSDFARTPFGSQYPGELIFVSRLA